MIKLCFIGEIPKHPGVHRDGMTVVIKDFLSADGKVWMIRNKE